MFQGKARLRKSRLPSFFPSFGGIFSPLKTAGPVICCMCSVRPCLWPFCPLFFITPGVHGRERRRPNPKRIFLRRLFADIHCEVFELPDARPLVLKVARIFIEVSCLWRALRGFCPFVVIVYFLKLGSPPILSFFARAWQWIKRNPLWAPIRGSGRA